MFLLVLLSSDWVLAASPPEMVLIPEGSFLMGSRQSDGRVGFEIGIDELPQQEVNLPVFYIDRFEVTVANYKRFLDETGRKPPGDPRFPEIYPWGRGEEPPAELMNHPVIYVTWYDADAYCRWASKRLPKEIEWEKAARGTDGRFWPWGNEFDPQKANVREYGARGTLAVGSFPDGVSPYGVYDMAGNVAEWVEDWYEGYPGSTLVREAFGKVNKVIRGGAWTLFGEPYGRVTHRTRSMNPKKQHRSIGFRCAMDAR